MFTNVSLGEECQEAGRGSGVFAFPKLLVHETRGSFEKTEKRPSFCLFETGFPLAKPVLLQKIYLVQTIFDFRKHEFLTPLNWMVAFWFLGAHGTPVISWRSWDLEVGAFIWSMWYPSYTSIVYYRLDLKIEFFPVRR